MGFEIFSKCRKTSADPRIFGLSAKFRKNERTLEFFQIGHLEKILKNDREWLP